MIDTCKTMVHQLTNQMQVVMGHLEMNDMGRALEAARESARLLRKLSRILATEHESDPNMKAS